MLPTLMHPARALVMNACRFTHINATTINAAAVCINTRAMTLALMQRTTKDQPGLLPGGILTRSAS